MGEGSWTERGGGQVSFILRESFKFLRASECLVCCYCLSTGMNEEGIDLWDEMDEMVKTFMKSGDTNGDHSCHPTE